MLDSILLLWILPVQMNLPSNCALGKKKKKLCIDFQDNFIDYMSSGCRIFIHVHKCLQLIKIYIVTTINCSSIVFCGLI